MKKISKYILIIIPSLYFVFSCKESSIEPKEDNLEEINVIYPNGGELFNSGDTVIVKWTSSTLPYPYNAYYKNENNNWVAIQEGITDTFTLWVTPSLNLENTKIKVDQIENDKILFSDSSDFPFSINYQHLVFLNPESTSIVFDSLLIRWDAVGIDKVNIFYNIDGGADWEILESQYNASIGMFNWTPPNLSSSVAKVMLSFQSNIDNTEIQIVSDEFRIVSKEEVNEALNLFPLHLGNVWIYRVDVISFEEDFSYFMKCELVDSTYENGIKFYKNKYSLFFPDTTFTNQSMYHHPNGIGLWIGVDSNNAVVKTIPEFSLLMKLGDSIVFTKGEFSSILVTEVGHEFIFNDNREYKQFGTYHAWFRTEYKYTYGVGIVHGQVSEEGKYGDFQLLGCVINNIVYGDTSTVF